jgi:hypothetical protein
VGMSESTTSWRYRPDTSGMITLRMITLQRSSVVAAARSEGEAARERQRDAAWLRAKKGPGRSLSDGHSHFLMDAAFPEVLSVRP